MPDSQLTVQLLASTLGALQEFPETELQAETPEKWDGFLRELAALAITGIAIVLKFLLSRHGEAEIKGFGAFSIKEGKIEFQPEPEVAQYAVITKPGPDQLAFVTAKEVLRELESARALLQLVKNHLNIRVPLPRTVEAELLTSADMLASEALAVQTEGTLRDLIEYLLMKIAEALTTPESREVLRPRSLGDRDEVDQASFSGQMSQVASGGS
jgi:hypothetical protein